MPLSDRVAGAMKQKLTIYRSVCEGHTPSCHTRVNRFETIAQGPTNHFPVGQIQNHCQVQPTLTSSDVGNV